MALEQEPNSLNGSCPSLAACLSLSSFKGGIYISDLSNKSAVMAGHLSIEGQHGRVQDQGKVQKMYVARVLGEFPETRQVVKAALCWDAKYNHVTAVEEGKTTNEAGLDAKPSHTEFERICVASDGKTSLVRCWYGPLSQIPSPASWPTLQCLRSHRKDSRPACILERSSGPMQLLETA